MAVLNRFDMLDYELPQMGTSNSKFLVARRVTLVVACGFSPKFWEGGRDLQMVFCQSVSAI